MQRSRRRKQLASPAGASPRVPREATDGELRPGELVFVATDDAEARQVLCDELGALGYRAVAVSTSSPIAELAVQMQPLLILLDLDRDAPALAMLARLHELGIGPVLALSSRAAEEAKVAALDAGADDYVVLPFGRLETLARIRVALRRARAARAATSELVEAGPIQIDTGRHLVHVAGKPVHLTPTEFRILASLVRSRDRAVSHHQLAHEVWGPGSDRTAQLREHVSALRKKLGDDAARPSWLLTVLGTGYRLRTR